MQRARLTVWRFKDVLSLSPQSTWRFAQSRGRELRCFPTVCCLAVEDCYLGADTTPKQIMLCAQSSGFPRSTFASFSIMDEERKNKTAWIQTIWKPLLFYDWMSWHGIIGLIEMLLLMYRSRQSCSFEIFTQLSDNHIFELTRKHSIHSEMCRGKWKDCQHFVGSIIHCLLEARLWFDTSPERESAVTLLT